MTQAELAADTRNYRTINLDEAADRKRWLSTHRHQRHAVRDETTGKMCYYVELTEVTITGLQAWLTKSYRGVTG